MQIQTKTGSVELELVQGDITRQHVDAIVNAANSSLLGGGGVDGAIHRAGGPSILEECKRIRALQGGCDPGQAVITGGGKLAARFVIHTVGPIWRDGTANEERTLTQCYANCLRLATDNELGSIAFPSISTGAFGYPLELASRVALCAVKDYLLEHGKSDDFGALGPLKLVRFTLFDAFTLNAYQEALSEL